MSKEIIREDDDMVILYYHDKIIKLTIGEPDSDTDLDDLTKIDISELIPEIVTIPAVMNRWGNIMAKYQAELSKKKLEFEIYCAKTKEEYIKSVVAQGMKKPTVDEKENALVMDEQYLTKSQDIIETQKKLDIVSSVYWSLKDKSGKLDKLSLTLHPDDLSSVKTFVKNGIKVLIKNPTIR